MQSGLFEPTAKVRKQETYWVGCATLSDRQDPMRSCDLQGNRLSAHPSWNTVLHPVAPSFACLGQDVSLRDSTLRSLYLRETDRNKDGPPSSSKEDSGVWKGRLHRCRIR